MNKKRILIVGTSHSESTCETHDDIGHIQYLQNMGELRWHDYFHTEYDYEVINISKSAISAEGQLLMVQSYFHDHPDSQFDLCIIEGRSLELNMAIPLPSIEVMQHPTNSDIKSQISGIGFDYLNDIENEKIWKYGTLDKHRWNHQSQYELITHMGPDSDQRLSDYLPWYLSYMGSALHATHTWGCNVAMITFLERYCQSVQFFAWSSTDLYLNTYLHEMGERLIPEKNSLYYGLHPNRFWMEYFDDYHEFYPHIFPVPPEYGDIPEWETVVGEDSTGKEIYHYYCRCRHLNPRGHRRFFRQFIEPTLLKKNLL